MKKSQVTKPSSERLHYCAVRCMRAASVHPKRSYLQTLAFAERLSGALDWWPALSVLAGRRVPLAPRLMPGRAVPRPCDQG